MRPQMMRAPPPNNNQHQAIDGTSQPLGKLTICQRHATVFFFLFFFKFFFSFSSAVFCFPANDLFVVSQSEFRGRPNSSETLAVSKYCAGEILNPTRPRHGSMNLRRFSFRISFFFLFVANLFLVSRGDSKNERPLATVRLIESKKVSGSPVSSDASNETIDRPEIDGVPSFGDGRRDLGLSPLPVLGHCERDTLS